MLLDGLTNRGDMISAGSYNRNKQFVSKRALAAYVDRNWPFTGKFNYYKQRLKGVGGAFIWG